MVAGRETHRVAALAAGLFVFGFGEELWARYLPEYLRQLGVSALVLGLFGTLTDLLNAAYAYPGGLASDRFGTRRALLLFATLTATGIAVYLLWPSVAAIFAGLFLVAAWKSLGLPATFALIAEELPAGRRIRGFTAQSIVRRLPVLLAPPLGGLLIASLGMARGMRAAFAISLLLSVAMLLALWAAFRRDPATKSAPLTHRVSHGQTETSRLHPTLRRLLVADCLIRLCEGLPSVFLVVWAIEIVRLSPPQFGLLQSVLMASAILSYLPAAARAGHTEKKPLVVLTFLFFTLFPLAVMFSHSFGSLAAAYVIGGLREIGEPARKALIVDLADPRARVKTVGLYYAVRGFVVAGAAAVGGALWTIRPSLTFGAAALLGAAGTIWAAVTLPGRRASVEAPA
jgi:MFS family permease